MNAKISENLIHFHYDIPAFDSVKNLCHNEIGFSKDPFLKLNQTTPLKKPGFVALPTASLKNPVFRPHCPTNFRLIPFFSGVIKTKKDYTFLMTSGWLVLMIWNYLPAFLTPPLTMVNAPTECAGKTAAQHLFNLLAGQKVDPVTLLPTEIVIRRSGGCSAYNEMVYRNF